MIQVVDHKKNLLLFLNVINDLSFFNNFIIILKKCIKRKSDLLERTHAKARGKEKVVRGLEKFMGFPLHGALISVAISPVLLSR